MLGSVVVVGGKGVAMISEFAWKRQVTRCRPANRAEMRSYGDASLHILAKWAEMGPFYTHQKATWACGNWWL